MDVADHGSIHKLAAELHGTPIDLLVNNAGYSGNGRMGEPFGHTDYSEWDPIFRINAMGPMMVSEAFADHVAASQQKVTLTISSQIGPKPSYGFVAYRAAKSAVNQVVKQLAIALALRGVIAIAIHPGWVQNDRTVGKAALTPDQSVAMPAAIVARATPADSGKFFAPDGSDLPLITQQMAPKPSAMTHERS